MWNGGFHHRGQIDPVRWGSETLSFCSILRHVVTLLASPYIFGTPFSHSKLKKSACLWLFLHREYPFLSL